jgi:hypothetical protein
MNGISFEDLTELCLFPVLCALQQQKGIYDTSYVEQVRVFISGARDSSLAVGITEHVLTRRMLIDSSYLHIFILIFFF